MNWYDHIVRSPIYGDQAADSRRTEFDVRNTVLVNHHVQPDIIFIGDSITHLWETAVYFRRYGLVINRGIQGDILPIIKERFAADVLQHRPRCCVLQGGNNSLWRLGQPFDAGVTQRALQTDHIVTEMLESEKAIMHMAGDAGIFLCVSSLVPCSEKWNEQIMPDTDWRYVNDIILDYNARLRSLCSGVGAVYVDYHAALVDASGRSMQPDLSIDGLHPYSAGYDRMAAVLYPVLDEFFGLSETEKEIFPEL